MGEACRALDFPVVSGNVSLYNETNGVGILPTPTIGAIGLVADVAKAPSIALKPGMKLVLIGETEGWLGASRYLAEIEGRNEGAPPPVDLSTERKNGECVADILAKHLCNICHDVSGGGILAAVAKMALAGDVGAEIAVPAGMDAHTWLFGEDQARYLLAVEDADAVLQAAKAASVSASIIGATGGDTLTVSGQAAISLSNLASAHEGWLPDYMAGA
jgi:phosphoribosylformylglycinamidine synthase